MLKLHDFCNRAAKIYLQETGNKESLEFLLQQLSAPDVAFSTTPQSLKRYASYMRELGLIKTQPERWQDLAFENLHDAPGS